MPSPVRKVLVVSNLALIQSNRRWQRRVNAASAWNPAFGWIALVTVGLLAAGAALCVLLLAWFEVVKWIDARLVRVRARA